MTVGRNHNHHHTVVNYLINQSVFARNPTAPFPREIARQTLKLALVLAQQGNLVINLACQLCCSQNLYVLIRPRSYNFYLNHPNISTKKSSLNNHSAVAAHVVVG